MIQPTALTTGRHQNEPDTQRHGEHGHSHGLVDPSIKRSREGLRVVGISLALLTATAIAQGAIYIATNSIALLADLIHNAGDALTAIPLAAAFLLRSERAERAAGLAVVLTILASAITAAVFAVERIIHPLAPDHLLALALAGVIGVIGNAIAEGVKGFAYRRVKNDVRDAADLADLLRMGRLPEAYGSPPRRSGSCVSWSATGPSWSPCGRG